MAAPIRAVLTQILSHRPLAPAIREAVTLCHALALAYLRHKIAAGTVIHMHLGISAEDLALDCISPLFERDSTGRFPVLSGYFQRVRWNDLSDQELSDAVRRLVFSRVNQELFKMYKETDPTLHRIIRNLKAACGTTPGISLCEKGDEQWVFFTDGPSCQDLPLAPPEYLAPYVTMIVAESGDTPAVLLELRQIVTQQHGYACGYPLVPLAILIRDAYAFLADTGTHTETTATIPDDLHRQDLEKLLGKAAFTVRTRMQDSYVGRGKITSALLDTYISVVTQVVRDEHLTDDGDPTSVFDHLRVLIPELSLEEYRASHRSILEYLLKLVRAEYLHSVRNQL